MEEVKDNRIQDETLEQINGGNDAQYAEIFNYIALHDPAAYAAIQAKNPMWRRLSAMRYLYDHGVPVVMTGNFLGENFYVLGTMDLEKRQITETRDRLNHAQLMDMIRKTLG